MLLIHLGIY